MKIKVIRLLILFIFILLITLEIIFLSKITFSFENPCSNLNEDNCQESYNSGFQTKDDCQTSYYCFPIYRADEFSECQFYPRTNLANCLTSPTTCYNGIPIDTSDYKRCYCGQGIEFREIDPCGNIGEWTGECLIIDTCIRKIKVFQEKQYEYFIDCKTPEMIEPINCSIKEESFCRDSSTFITAKYFYLPNECNTACKLTETEIITEIKCDCKDNICIGNIAENEKETWNPFYKKDTDTINQNEIIFQNKSNTLINQNTSENNIKNSINNITKPNSEFKTNISKLILIILLTIGSGILLTIIILIEINKKRL